MGFRRFTDREGRVWEVRPRSRSEWEFEEIDGGSGAPLVADAPTYETDPFELSIEELQRLLDRARPFKTRSKPSPFKD
ncbi:MAG: hypothetical protein KatS3mg081_2616 [Gemmatimonadales bacterium]|nr:hypothetical protein HRbin33_01634 [bacterium HR33]GIW53261.1 MAG: hypothetical protein KatS3mg081_2616 [Gemmatimonadales bacterium]